MAAIHYEQDGLVHEEHLHAQKDSCPLGQSFKWLLALGTAITFISVIGVLGIIAPPTKATAGHRAARPAPDRVFLHIADTHADAFYDYRDYFLPAPKLTRSPKYYSNDEPAEECGYATESLILQHWNRTGGGPSCPCGQFGSNPPFSVLQSLALEIQHQRPEFVIWSGDFASHYEPGTAQGDTCKTARSMAKATVTMVNAQTPEGITHIWGWGNNDVVPKRAPLEQSWLEEFGEHLLDAGWLKPRDMGTWNAGGFFRRNLGRGLCVLTLNSNSWTENQVNEKHHVAQLQWFAQEAFTGDKSCTQFLINAHVPLGWLVSGSGHYQWDNLQGVEVVDHAAKYRAVIEKHFKVVIAELYGHINKADLRLMHGKRAPQHDPKEGEAVGDSKTADPAGDIDENIGGEGATVSFTVSGISRRAMNDPQFQRIILEEPEGVGAGRDGHGGRGMMRMRDIVVYAMERGCDWTFGYSLKKIFAPHFDEGGITVANLKKFVADKSMTKTVLDHMATSAAPYTKADLTDPEFIKAVRAGVKGCEVRKKKIIGA